MNVNAALKPFERVVERYGTHAGYLLITVVLVFLWAPIGVLVLMSFADQSSLTFPPDGFTLEWYVVFLQNDGARAAFSTSLQISFIATPVAVVIATLIAYAADRYTFLGKNTIQLLAALPIIVPLVVVGVALSLFFGSVGLGSGFWSVVLSHVIRIIPFAFLIIMPTFIQFDTTLEEAAKDLGANEFGTFRQVTLPNIMPGIVAGAVLAFTISFNEFVYTWFVKDTATQTLPTFIWEEIAWSATPEVNVISVVFLGVAVLSVAVAVALTNVRRITRRGR